MESTRGVALRHQTPSDAAYESTDRTYAAVCDDWNNSNRETSQRRRPFSSPRQWDAAGLQSVVKDCLADASQAMRVEVNSAVAMAFEKQRAEQSNAALGRRSQNSADFCKYVVSNAIHNTLIQRVPFDPKEVSLLESVRAQVDYLVNQPWMMSEVTYV
jgi:hypothetical protein